MFFHAIITQVLILITLFLIPVVFIWKITFQIMIFLSITMLRFVIQKIFFLLLYDKIQTNYLNQWSQIIGFQKVFQKSKKLVTCLFPRKKKFTILIYINCTKKRSSWIHYLKQRASDKVKHLVKRQQRKTK